MQADVIGSGEQAEVEKLRRFYKYRERRNDYSEGFWKNSDPGAEITKMKDGTILLVYLAENNVDAELSLIIGAQIGSPIA